MEPLISNIDNLPAPAIIRIKDLVGNASQAIAVAVDNLDTIEALAKRYDERVK